MGGVLKKGKTGNGGVFASLAEAGTGYRTFGSRAVSNLAREILASGLFNGTSR